MQHMFTKVTTLATLFALAAGLASCGGGGKPGLTIVLAPVEGAGVANVDQALDGAVAVIGRRLDEFDVKGGKVRRDGDQLVVEASAESDADTLASDLTQKGLLEFCQPVVDAEGNVAVARQGTVRYESGTCEPARDAEGNIVVNGGTVQFVPWGDSSSGASVNNPKPDVIVWEPATAEIDGVEKALTSEFLMPDTFVSENSITLLQMLIFEWTGEGGKISGEVTTRLATHNYPLAPFLDGQPLRDANNLPIAPSVQGTITNNGQISGLSLEEAQHLSKLLNSGVLPVALRVVESPQG
jgi:preprotein translocase subunit SecD